MQVPETERIIGIELYSTSTAGIGGILRQVPEDFDVKEISGWEITHSGKYLIANLIKKDWDTNHIIRDISRALAISQKRIGFAGTKDKRAVTTQRISIFDISETDLSQVSIKDIQLRPLGLHKRAIVLGDLRSNIFKIIIRNIGLSYEELNSRMHAITSHISDAGGVPNFFGIQRFGAIRPVTHLVGEALIHDSAKKAVMIYLGSSFKDETEETKKVRNSIMSTQDFAKGLNEFPPRLRYERTMMHYLIEHPGDFAGAFSVLSDGMKRIFVHAYQSFIFNKIICARMSANLPFNKAMEGDIVCFKNADGLPDTSKTQKVTAINLDGMNNLISKGRAFVTAPLFGYSTELASGIPGQIESTIISELKLTHNHFKLPEIPQLASKGQRREILLNVKPQYWIQEDSLNVEKQQITMEFTLAKGSYATTVLREYMKVEPIEMS